MVELCPCGGRRPLNATITVDHHHPHRREAVVVLVGNVGEQVGGIDLIPRSQARSGLLHVFVASPHRKRDWFRVAVHVATRRGHKGDSIDSFGGSRVVVEIDEPQSYEVDGDVMGFIAAFRGRGQARRADRLGPLTEACARAGAGRGVTGQLTCL